MSGSGAARAWGWVTLETSLESGVGEEAVDNSGLSFRRPSFSLVCVMRRNGLGKGLGTLMEPVPSPGKNQDSGEGAVRLFLRTPERPTAGPTVEERIQERTQVSNGHRMGTTPGWIPVVLVGLDALLVGVAGLLLSVGARENGKVLVLGSILIVVAGVMGVIGAWLRHGE